MAVAATATVETGATNDEWASDLIQQAHARAVRATTAEAAAFLQGLVGQKLTAMAAGIDDPKAVGKWARGEREPRGDAVRRLREAFHVAVLLSLGESEQTARAWLMGMNPHLDDRAPVAMFAASPDGSERVMRAARAFLAHG
jgi:hypothetical protein